ncbi:hypothetical protein ACN3XK_40150 [Actinomadura welshii]
MEIGDLHFTYGNVALLAVAVFLLAGVYSFVKQGLKIAALIVLVLAALAVTGSLMWA